MNNKPLDKTKLIAIAQAVKAKGHGIQEAAAYNGSWNDGGGVALIKEADAFIAGLNGVLPAGWIEYAEQADTIAADYAMLQKLRKRFNE